MPTWLAILLAVIAGVVMGGAFIWWFLNWAFGTALTELWKRR